MVTLQAKNMIGQYLPIELKKELKSILPIIAQALVDIVNSLNAQKSDEKPILIWLVKQIGLKQINPKLIEEDFNVIIYTLKKYLRYRKQLNKLQNYTYSELKVTINQFQQQVNIVDILENPIAISGNYKLYEIKDIKIATEIAKGTSWCTQGERWAKKYLSMSSLFVITNKGKREAQLFFPPMEYQEESIQCKDVNDNECSLKQIKKYAKMFRHILSLYAEKCLKSYALLFIENPTEEMQMIAVRYNAYSIEYIKNPSERVQLEAVKYNANAIKYIKNPTEEMQMIAVKQNEYIIQYIKNPSERVQLEAVRQNGLVIAYIKNPSEKVQLEAVRQNAFAIKYIKNPREQVKLEAVKKTHLLFNI